MTNETSTRNEVTTEVVFAGRNRTIVNSLILSGLHQLLLHTMVP